MDDGYVRIGICFTAPRGTLLRRDEYGIDHPVDQPEALYVRYLGYREMRDDGEAQVGLPSAGPMAWWNQPRRTFVPAHFNEVRYFGKETA